MFHSASVQYFGMFNASGRRADVFPWNSHYVYSIYYLDHLITFPLIYNPSGPQCHSHHESAIVVGQRPVPVWRPVQMGTASAHWLERHWACVVVGFHPSNGEMFFWSRKRVELVERGSVPMENRCTKHGKGQRQQRKQSN